MWQKLLMLYVQWRLKVEQLDLKYTSMIVYDYADGEYIEVYAGSWGRMQTLVEESEAGNGRKYLYCLGIEENQGAVWVSKKGTYKVFRWKRGIYEAEHALLDAVEFIRK